MNAAETNLQKLRASQVPGLLDYRS